MTTATDDVHWDNRFTFPGVRDWISAVAENGDRLFAAGLNPDNNANSAIYLWDGSKWTVIGEVNGSFRMVRALAFLGEDLYVGGFFETMNGRPMRGLARWHAGEWQEVSGFAGVVYALAKKGSGLVVAGSFDPLVGVRSRNIAEWNGATWNRLGDGLGGDGPDYYGAVEAILASEQEIIAGGIFSNSGGSPMTNIARWNGSTWQPIGGGINGEISALARSSTTLYAGGTFDRAGEVPSENIAQWEGNAWSPLGAGLKREPQSVHGVSALAWYNNELYAAGGFTNSGPVPVRRLAMWNGNNWNAVGDGCDDFPSTLVVSNARLFAGGLFGVLASTFVYHIGVFDGSTWSALGPPDKMLAAGNIVYDIAAVSPAEVYVGGGFTFAGLRRANRVAMWNGNGWSPLGSGLEGSTKPGLILAARTLLYGAEGLYVGGSFATAGGLAANNVARWDGTQWHPLGSGLGSGQVLALQWKGPDLFAAGEFTAPGVTNLARWDGQTWRSVPGDFVWPRTASPFHALAADETYLYLGGTFSVTNRSTRTALANHLARFDGNAWSNLGEGVNGQVETLLVRDHTLYVGGFFSRAGAVDAPGIARWDGQGWSSVGGLSGIVRQLTFANEELYAGGTIPGGVQRWDGLQWHVFGTGLDRSNGSAAVTALAVAGTDLYAGGLLDRAGGKESQWFAHWNSAFDFSGGAQAIPKISVLGAAAAGKTSLHVSAPGAPAVAVEESADLKTWQEIVRRPESDFHLEISLTPGAKFYRAVALGSL